MNNYTMSDWAKMQNAAERRVKNTKEYTDSLVNRKTAVPQQPAKKKSGGILNLLNFDKIDFNKDTSTILMLLALLGKDGEQDDILILALLYIML